MSEEPQYPPTWPGVMGREQQPGMKITGKLVAARQFDTRSGDSRVSIDLETEDGTIVSVPAWHYSLNQLLNDMGQAGEIGYGSELTIEYEGEKRLDTGNTLKLYRVNGQSTQGGAGRAPSWFSGGEPPVPQPARPSAGALAEVVAQGAPPEEDDDEDLPF